MFPLVIVASLMAQYTNLRIPSNFGKFSLHKLDNLEILNWEIGNLGNLQK